MHIHWHHPALKRLCTSLHKVEHHGVQEASMHGTVALHSITIHYRNCKFYVPSTKAYRTSGSYDLFPQHCILPTFTPEQHTQEVYTELFESIQKLTKPAKRKFLRKVAKALEVLATLPSPTAPPISEGEPTSEGAGDPIVFQRVKDSPMVTTTNNPTDPKVVQTTPRIHQRQTRANNPGQLPTIINPANDLPTTRRSPRLTNWDEAPIITTTTPSSARIPLHTPNIIAMQAVNLLTQQVYSETEPTWLPNSFISSSPIDQQTAYNVDIEMKTTRHGGSSKAILKRHMKFASLPDKVPQQRMAT